MSGEVEKLELEIKKIFRKAQDSLKKLQDTNSAFPATREFLLTRGLTNVSEQRTGNERSSESPFRCFKQII